MPATHKVRHGSANKDLNPLTTMQRMNSQGKRVEATGKRESLGNGVKNISPVGDCVKGFGLCALALPAYLLCLGAY